MIKNKYINSECDIKSKNYIFSKSHLSFFAKEMKEAGGFEDLMLKKKSIERIDGRTVINIFPDIEKYKDSFLTGKYKSLRSDYKTKVPYSFWSQFYIALKRNMRPSK